MEKTNNDFVFRDIVVDYLKSYNYEIVIHDCYVNLNNSKQIIYEMITKDLDDENNNSLDCIYTYIGTSYQEIFDQFYDEIIDHIEQDEIDDRLSKEQIDFVKNYKK